MNVKHTVVTSNRGLVFKGTPKEVRYWLRHNSWALSLYVQKSDDGELVPATVYMGLRHY